MTTKEELIEYCNNCINDILINKYEDYLSCQKHKWACQRLLNDFKKEECRNVLNEPYIYYWDEEEAEKIVNWFTYLRHSKGELAGQPINLNIWQKFFICQIYGWRKKDNKRRRFKKSFIECARKQAKSQMESGIALYELACGSTRNKEVYEICCAGIKRKQSKVVFEEAKLMLRGSPLATKFKCTRDYIKHIKTGSTMIALSKEDGTKNDGGNMALFILDEYHQHPTDDFYTMASYGQNTKESLLMIITTAGVDLNSPCYTQEYKYCSDILNPSIDIFNDTYFVDIVELDKNDDILDKRNWWKANPLRMTYKQGVEKIEEEFEIAKQIPEKMPSFMTKCLDIWVQAKDKGYMDMEKWKDCEVEKIPYELKNKTVFVGFDMSAKIDLTSVAFIIPILDEGVKKYVCFSHSFIPNRQKLMERTLKDKVPYDAWERLEYLTITNTPIVDQQQVMDYVLRTCKENSWNIDSFWFDPANASKLMMDLSNECEYPILEVFQSHKSLNEATQGFREQVYCKNVIYTNNSLLNFAMNNAVIKENGGLIKIDKDATTKKIDPIDAMLCAFKGALYYEFIDTIETDKWLESDEW
ncbi:terminase large subunit [Clostridium botulinum]|uniref:terminase large subunit n=1 Tax=Clostridium botulinum TaxID=1491 RepID=UPI0013F1156E|nr:terminase TerL endonuclease subunit [Clostridium botulinum]MBN1051629.1 terminase large subunit [Clostridium botulinum]MBN1061305.1 terminase large subunit [Clostridium botulinum]MCS6110719.1 terminase large subunit [Clostridium botulinum]NFE11249.1 terminase large subunit [Clostridium botulinum]